MAENDLTQARALIEACREKEERHLDLGKCGITDLNDLPELFECSHLESLNLSHVWLNDNNTIKHSKNKENVNEIDAIPSSISKLAGLRSLILCFNQITDISVLEHLNQLQYLDLWNNQITDISVLEHLNQLHVLFLRSNQITDISVLEHLNQLQSLNLWNNQITDISVLEHLNQLQSLDLNSSQITDISVLEHLNQLQSLNLSSSQITDISVLEHLNQLQSLDLNSSQITDISVLEHLNQLQSLDLSSNQITDISVLEHLNQLQSLNLSSNQITDISVLEHLNQLQSLNLSSNQIIDISVLEHLNQLQSLNLSSSQITDISVLEHLNQLQSLNLSSNQIADTSVLEHLNQLQSLNLSSNQITDISVLEHLNQLQSLNLSSNQITDIPLPIFHMNMEVTLEEYGAGIRFHGNPIGSPPIEIIEQGRQAVLDWFEANKVELDEIKVILIGDPKAGKTSLLRRLKDDSFSEDEPQTDGVNIEDIAFGTCGTFTDQPDIHHLTGHFWDFGGQEIMNATHQFFLTSRSVYILVLDARKDDNVSSQIRQWVKRIRATGGNSSIIVVANQIDVNTGFGFENAYELQRDFPQIKEFIRASCKTPENIDVIKAKLEELIPQAEFFSTSIDERWIGIKDELQKETRAEYFLHQDRFKQICQSHKLLKKREQKSAITFLHDLGLVLHFEDVDLKEYYVLDPYWITYGVYQILTSSLAGKMKGKVAMDQLEFIINEEEEKEQQYHPSDYKRIEYSPNGQRFLVDILNVFKLCFTLSDRSHFIIPDLLDTREPLEITEPIRTNADGIRFVYEYGYPPRTIMPHIMVDTHHILTEMWRTGCVLQSNGCTALVTNYQNRISIVVTGDYKKKSDFMAVIRHVIDLINHNLSDKPDMLIPLPGVDDAYAYYEELLDRLQEGQTHYSLYKPEKRKFEISKLLEGVPGQNELWAIRDKVDEVLARQNTIIANQMDIKIKLDAHYEFLVIQSEISGEILESIKEIDASKTTALADEMIGCLDDLFNQFADKMDDKLQSIYADIKNTDNYQMKLKLAVPFIHLLGVKLETEFDIKGWAKQMYDRYEVTLFKLMGYLD